MKKMNLAALLSFLFSALLLPDIVRLPIAYLLPAVAYLLLFNFFVMYLVCHIRKLAVYTIPPIFFISAITSYFYGVYRIKIDKELLFLLLETTTGEAGEFITTELIIFGAIALLLTSILTYLLKHSSGKFNGKVVAILFIVLLPTTFLLGKYKKNPHVRIVRPITATKYIFPYSVITCIAEFSGQYFENLTQGERESSAKLPSIFIPQKKPLQVIVVIGESARADRFQINGYPRETTPNLMKEKNLINFGGIQSFAAYTRLSVPAMITPATSQHPESTMSSYLGLFKKHGFKTTWISANDRFNSNDTPTTKAIGDVDNSIFRNSLGNVSYGEFYDAMLLTPLQETLVANAQHNQAITLHTRGSHANYAARYPEEFKKFLPDAYDEKMQPQQVSNAYDNSILATDSFIASIIELVRDKNAVVIYSSDHGESLGEEGRFGHGNALAPEQRNVPFFIWYSDDYRKLNETTVDTLKKHVGSSLSHDVFFPWILNLGGILLPDTNQPVLLSVTK